MATIIEASERQQGMKKTEMVLASESSTMVGANPKRAAQGAFRLPRPTVTLEANLPGRVGALLLPANVPLPPARRLVVLVPDSEVDEAGLAACIWALASQRGLSVLFLSTMGQPQEQYRARRRLATLAAITRDDCVHVDTQVSAEQGWRPAVEDVWQQGDLVVCHRELTVVAGLGKHPLAQALVSSLLAPVYVIAGFYPTLTAKRSGRVAGLLSLLPSVLILLGFFALQAQITQATQGGLQTILLVLTVIVEFGLILAWEQFAK